MADNLEREIKLRWENAGAARAAIVAIGGTALAARRLQHDRMLDTPDGTLRDLRSVLRLRTEEGRAVLTFKGPVQASTMKLREELETTAGDADVLMSIFDRLGFRVWFRYEKYREEFARDGAVIAVDETPVGTFIEIEGAEAAIHDIARALGRQPDQYLVDSYRGLFLREREARGLAATDMLFDETRAADQPGG
jgi:adenylate cyclase class 2